ncbi:MAG: MoaD/ThiS family protein [Dermatophilaceae bacterium]
MASVPAAPGGVPRPEGDGIPLVTVRYWAAARAATGVETEQLGGATVGDVMDAAVERHPTLAPVLALASVLVDGLASGRDAPVVAGLTLEVLPPFAGG